MSSRTISVVGLIARGLRASAPTARIPSIRHASSSFRMPAMSPTMTEGGIASWKKQEGDTFAAGDVLLEIETDKATIDVEAQDDGVVGKIISLDGAQKIPVGQIIAILAEEGDDLSSISVPSDLGPEGSASQTAPETSSASSSGPSKQADEAPKTESENTPAPSADNVNHGHKVIKHPKPLFPSVQRLLIESNLSSEEISKLIGTGRHGMLTKGDVLVATGIIKDAKASASKIKETKYGVEGMKSGESASTAATAAPEKPMTGDEIRRLIMQGMENASKATSTLSDSASSQDFESILEPYNSLVSATRQPLITLPSVDVLVAEKEQTSSGSTKKDCDEWEGLY